MSTLLLRGLAVAPLFGLLALAGCGGHSGAPAQQATSVSVSAALEAPVADYEDFTGRTEAVESVNLMAQATGYLKEVMFEDGAYVKQKQQLYQIDDSTYVTTVKNTQAAVKRSEASLEKANADLSRARQMTIGSAISREEYDQIVARKQQAQATLAENKATLENAELNLAYCKVLSPIDGIVSRTQITKGNLINKNQTVLTTIVSVDPIYAYFDVDERTTLRIQQMMREEVSEEGIKKAREYLERHKVKPDVIEKVTELLRGRVTPQVSREIDDLIKGHDEFEPDWLAKRILYKYPKYPNYRKMREEGKGFPVLLATQIEKGYPHEGFIDFVETQLSATTGTLRIRGRFPNPNRVLTPKLFVRIRLPIGESHPAVLISDTAVVVQQDRKFVYVVDPETKGAKLTPVRLGALRNGLRVVESGVKKGDLVIVEGAHRVLDKTKVEYKDLISMPGYVAPPKPQMK